MSQPSVLRAHASDRLSAPLPVGPSISESLERAAEAAARLGSSAYSRLARFTGEGARTIHVGSKPAAAADVIGRVVVRIKIPSEPTETAAPDAFQLLADHMRRLRRSARDGVIEGMTEATRYFQNTAKSMGVAVVHSRDALKASALRQSEAFTGFARAAFHSSPMRTVSSAPIMVRDEIGRIRLAALGAATGAIMAVGTTLDRGLSNVARLGRFFSDTSLGIQVGATEALRKVGQSSQLRLGAYLVAGAGVAAAAFYLEQPHVATALASIADNASHQFSGNGGLGQAAVHMVGHAQIAMPSEIAQSLSNSAHHARDLAYSGQHVAAAFTDGLARDAHQFGQSHAVHVATEIGRTALGREIVHLAMEHAVDTTGSTTLHAVHVHAQKLLHSRHFGVHHYYHPAYAVPTADQLNGMELRRLAAQGSMPIHHAVYQPHLASMDARTLNGRELEAIRGAGLSANSPINPDVVHYGRVDQVPPSYGQTIPSRSYGRSGLMNEVYYGRPVSINVGDGIKSLIGDPLGGIVKRLEGLRTPAPSSASSYGY